MAGESNDAVVTVSCERAAVGWRCEVRVAENGTSTAHTVTVSDEELARYAETPADVKTLVHDAFRFLLEREPKESILRRFTISDIERYFPEFANRSGAA
jgi:hypothetical protein